MIIHRFSSDSMTERPEFGVWDPFSLQALINGYIHGKVIGKFNRLDLPKWNVCPSGMYVVTPVVLRGEFITR